MHGIDTNLLVRFLTWDDPIQSAQAEAFFRDRCSSVNPGWISVIVLCELVWVLRGKRHDYDKVKISAVIDTLLRIPFFEIEDEASVRNALQIWNAGTLDFPDALIGERNRQAGCDTTFTFDRRAAGTGNFSEVPEL